MNVFWLSDKFVPTRNLTGSSITKFGDTRHSEMADMRPGTEKCNFTEIGEFT